MTGILLAVLLAASTLAVQSASAGHESITICHAPPGEPENVQTLTIAIESWAPHERHGDQIGACAVEEPAAEEPAAEDPAVNESAPEEPVVEDALPEEPAAEELAVEGLVAEELVAEILADLTAPVLTLPASLAALATSFTGASVSFAASAMDDTDGALAASCTPASGTTFMLGTTTVSCSANDTAGNAATGSFDVTVALPTAPTGRITVSAIQPTARSDSLGVYWRTDVPTLSRLYYGTSLPLTSYLEETAYANHHSLVISGLTSETTYWFQILSVDASGRTDITNAQSARTLATAALTDASATTLPALTPVPSGERLSSTSTVEYGVAIPAATSGQRVAVVIDRTTTPEANIQGVEIGFGEGVDGRTVSVLIEQFPASDRPDDVALGGGIDSARVTEAFLEVKVIVDGEVQRDSTGYVQDATLTLVTSRAFYDGHGDLQIYRFSYDAAGDSVRRTLIPAGSFRVVSVGADEVVIALDTTGFSVYAITGVPVPVRTMGGGGGGSAPTVVAPPASVTAPPVVGTPAHKTIPVIAIDSASEPVTTGGRHQVATDSAPAPVDGVYVAETATMDAVVGFSLLLGVGLLAIVVWLVRATRKTALPLVVGHERVAGFEIRGLVGSDGSTPSHLMVVRRDGIDVEIVDS